MSAADIHNSGSDLHRGNGTGPELEFRKVLLLQVAAPVNRLELAGQSATFKGNNTRQYMILVLSNKQSGVKF